MVSTVNRQWLLARHPDADEIIGEQCFEWHEGPVPEPDAGEFVVRTLCLGTSPAQRAYTLRERRFHTGLKIGDVMRSRGVGVVAASRHPDFAKGDIVTGSLGWQDYSVQDAEGSALGGVNVRAVQRVLPIVRPVAYSLGTLGAAGVTAYVGLVRVAELQAGDTVVVSAAAGGVGSMAVQIAKILGCYVVGVAGGPEKCRWLTDELGCDAAIDYRGEDLGRSLDEHCPDGVDLLFDNVGGEILEACLQRIRVRGRIALCGYITSEYDARPAPGPAHYFRLIYQRASMRGFVVWDYVQEFDKITRALCRWHDDGRLRPTEDIVDGLEQAPRALGDLFRGANRGIRLTRVCAEPEAV